MAGNVNFKGCCGTCQALKYIAHAAYHMIVNTSTQSIPMRLKPYSDVSPLSFNKCPVDLAQIREISISRNQQPLLHQRSRYRLGTSAGIVRDNPNLSQQLKHVHLIPPPSSHPILTGQFGYDGYENNLWSVF